MSPEQFDPDPFLEQLVREGMPWRVRDDSARVAPSGGYSAARETVAAA